jgi:hypothetical protein
LTPTTRLWSGVGGALAWLFGSRSLRYYKLGTVGTLLLYRAIANSPAKPLTRAKTKRAPRKTSQPAG